MFKIYAPLRVDLCGGVTDISNFSSVTGTCITNIALDLFSDEYFKIKCQIYTEFKNSQFKVVNDLPVSTGLGGSAVLIIEYLAGLHKLSSNGDIKNLKFHINILKKAYLYETKNLNIKGGFQDYISAFFGGLNFINFPSINNLNLNKKYLGLIPEIKILNYLNENMLVLILKKNNRNSSEIVTDEINNFKKNNNPFISKLKEIKKCNEEVFKLLMNKGNLEQRLLKMEKLINKSWNFQKQLSNFLGKGLLSDLEFKLKPFTFGLRGPGAGVNSLFLVLKKGKKKKVLSILKKYQDSIYIFHPRINTTGLQIIT